MSVFYYEPYYNLDRLFDSAFFRGASPSPQGQQRLAENDNHNQVQRFLKPKMDLHENAETNTVTATFEFPGIDKEAIQIDVHNGRMTVSAETKISSDHDHEGYAVRERRFGKFSRTLQLPQGVKVSRTSFLDFFGCRPSSQEDEIKAAMENGVLTITFPKAGAEQAPKKITIA
ncbi:HSP20-like chaperone [Mycena floridula]|nr:HSP20-like chaperone [Mycena floridula]